MKMMAKNCHKHSTHDKCLADSINNTVLTVKSKIPGKNNVCN